MLHKWANAGYTRLAFYQILGCVVSRSKAAVKKFRLRGDIELDDKEYAGKRVSAEALFRGEAGDDAASASASE